MPAASAALELTTASLMGGVRSTKDRNKNTVSGFTAFFSF